jgi:hypothetical protein
MSVVLITEPFSGGGGGSGTVTSVDVSGGTTGLTTSGGPVTTAGVITLGGLLNVANGGTGTATPALVAGTNVTITGTWPNQTINASGGGGGGSGTVTSVSVTSGNGLAGTVTNPTTTPAISLSTTVTGVLKGNGTVISAAVSGTDYLAPPSGTSILKGNSGGALANAIAGTDYQVPITLTTTGTSGAASFNGTTLNIPQYSGGGGGTPGGSDTQIQFNSSGSFGGSANFTWDGTNVQLGTQGALRFADADSSNYVAFKAPATVSSNVTWTLPSIDGSAAQVLSTNGAGTLSWVTQSGGGGGGSPNLDGGTPTSNYGGITAIDGGTP